MQISNELNIKHWIILDFLKLRKLSRVIINQLRRNYFLAAFNKYSNNIDSIAFKILIDFEKYTSSKNYKSFMINDILDIECIEID
jgi:spore coat protein CotH